MALASILTFSPYNGVYSDQARQWLSRRPGPRQTGPPLNATLAVNMNTPSAQYFLNGDQPPIVGETCEGFYLQQYQEQQQVTDPANVAYLKFNGQWVCLYFEGGTIFWRESDQPGEPVNNGVDSALVLVNLCEMSSVVGARLEAISCNGNEHLVEVALSFSSGRILTFRHSGESDATTFDC